jgi:hypothetical protein
MSGNGTVLGRVHAHLGERLKHSMAVGRSHHESPARRAGLAGPRPEFFFAPNQVKKRVQAWGAHGYQERIAAAVKQFVDASGVWLTVRVVDGLEQAAITWKQVHAGRARPDVGYIVRCTS